MEKNSMQLGGRTNQVKNLNKYDINCYLHVNEVNKDID